MVELEEAEAWRVRGGAYLGEISALSLLPSSPSPLLLAGTGSELLLYDLKSADLTSSFQIFNGIRVHGIAIITHSSTHNLPYSSSSSSSSSFTIAIFGERTLKLFLLTSHQPNNHLHLLHALPPFDHWVLDACFLEREKHLAVGLSDNSVALWDLSTRSLIARVKSQDKCLLYSMRLCGDTIATLRVASGTIDNKIIVWKLEEGEELTAVNLRKLFGHEGSIFRLAWSDDGSKLMSASDDRSARIWDLTGQSQNEEGIERPSELTLFGHHARIWDCYFSDSIIISAGEDCTCRLWGIDGSQIMILKEHIGRGIWRCLYEPSLSLIITAGFDSAIKINEISSSLLEGKGGPTISDIFTISTPKATKQLGFIDSKSEYVRCLQFTEQNMLYVSTNNGYLYHVNISNPKYAKWTQLIQVNEKVAVICMDVTQEGGGVVALGDGKGNVTVVKVKIDEGEENGAKAELFFTWSAEKERQLLGLFWCKSLGSSYLFTGDPRGMLKLWNIEDNFKFNKHDFPRSTKVHLTAIFESCFGARIMCIDASPKEEILVAGDNKGNLTIFLFGGRRFKMENSTVNIEEKIPLVDRFKGAHGISSVTSVYISESDSSNVEIRTTGGDGCICLFKYGKSIQKMEFIGMKQAKELGTVQSVYSDLAIGFISADFVIWDLVNETKVIQIPCGGWRRPYSYYLGAVPQQQNCFAYLKDEEIHVHRLWVAVNSEKQVIPQVLHMQFHGREIHTLSFISLGTTKMKQEDNTPFALVATGCEDGTVRLTRYSLIERKWKESKLLGEHVGGSAVRSICFTPETHPFRHHHLHGSRSDCEIESDDRSLLISVGSKQVLTCWVLNEGKNGSTATFQWFSSHVPPRVNNINKEREHDWRYMAVTAFILKINFARMSVCFIVVACSDATLVLRALLLPSRLWFDVATLGSQTSPVLALQYIVVSGHEITNNGDRYIIISGATDGSITFWDITQSINHFMQSVAEIQPQTLIDCQTRPKTGRGSCGGRKWRSLTNYSPKKSSNQEEEFAHQNKNTSDCLPEVEPLRVLSRVHQSGRKWRSLTNREEEFAHPKNKNTSECLPEEVEPLRVLRSVHQSGVNCLRVIVSSDDVCLIVSGGDDQALNCFTFRLEGTGTDGDVKIRVLSEDGIASAHSSAVKGIWTDGSWVFSTGLDQRVRCWRFDQIGKLAEYAHIIINVPEPETLDAVISDREKKRYQIAVAGRGMQMVEFSLTI